MSDKKRSADEVNDFLSKYKKEISRRLESISLTKLTKDEIIKTSEEIKSIKEAIKNKILEIKAQKAKLQGAEKYNSSLDRRNSKTTSLMGDVKDDFHNGIRIFDPEEIEEELEETTELNTENE
jgi:hypothetical protein